MNSLIRVNFFDDVELRKKKSIHFLIKIPWLGKGNELLVNNRSTVARHTAVALDTPAAFQRLDEGKKDRNGYLNFPYPYSQAQLC
jgi:hypothetical protein